MTTCARRVQQELLKEEKKSRFRGEVHVRQARVRGYDRTGMYITSQNCEYGTLSQIVLCQVGYRLVQ